ncbi:MAG: hypothetical protein M3R27_00140 [Bacteroidota bacterium]|nr:hypothetical protein [Bacteroidota bacterium]
MKNQFKIFLSILFISALHQASAQDTIVQKSNDMVIANILEISGTTVKYRRFDLPDGPIYTVKREDLIKIKYKNGMVDNFSVEKPGNNESELKAPQQVDMTPRYILIMNNGTQLRGKLLSETKTEVVFLDNNLGSKTISRDKISSLKLAYGEEVQVFTLMDGSIITGKIINKTEKETIVETKDLGIVVLQQYKIREVRELEEATITDGGKIWFKNPNCTRYLFAPSAMALKKGEGYYQNIYGLGNAVNYGLTDNFTIGGGLVGPLGGYVNAKVGINLGEYLNVGAGAIAGNGFFPVNGDNLGMGLGFAVVTVGNFDHNITVGAGYGFLNAGGTTDAMEKPLYVINGMARVGKKFALVTENWVVNVQGDPFNRGFESDSHYETFFSYAFRYMGQRSTLDAGFLNTPGLIEQGWYVGIPYIGFVIRFGNYKDN